MKKTLLMLTSLAALGSCASEPTPIPEPTPAIQEVQAPAPAFLEAPVVQEAPKVIPVQDPSYQFSDALTGSKAGKVTNQDSPHGYQVVDLNGQSHLIRPNTHPKDTELHFRLTRTDLSTIVINPGDRTVDLESNTTYIPTRVTKPVDPTKPAGDQKLAKEIWLSTTGPLGVKAERNYGTSTPLGVAKRTESATPFTLRTMTFADQGDFYVGLLPTGTGPTAKTDIYLMPVGAGLVGPEHTERLIRPNGQMGLRNPGDLYKLTEVSSANYQSRIDTTNAPIIPKPGQIEAIK
jgi:hypothetical protein